MEFSSHDDDYAADDGSMEEGLNSSLRNATWLHQTVHVVLIYPPTAEPSTHTLVNTVILICCLTLGICGNASQIALQWYANRLRISRPDAVSTCSQLYICLLHLVHFAISASLPSVIIDNLVKIWMFGMLTCRSHFIFVTAGRTMAGWAIALLFVDQYVVLALWKKIAGHLQAFFMCSLAMVALIASIVLVPSLFFVQINEVVLHEEHTSPNTLLRIRTFTCLTRLPRTFSPYANALNVILDFLMPLLVVLVMSRKTSIILAAANGSTRLCQKKICICLVVLATMHFIAYLPHWIAVFLVLVHDTWQLEAPQWLQTMLGDAVLLLPQITASTAWMPASYLSAQLCSRSYSYEMVTEASACRTSTLKRNSQMANTDFSRHSVAVTL